MDQRPHDDLGQRRFIPPLLERRRLGIIYKGPQPRERSPMPEGQELVVRSINIAECHSVRVTCKEEISPTIPWGAGL
eukprot:15460750-Alexandrium_andersonii.AAC.1